MGRTAPATWRGDLEDERGGLSAESRALEGHPSVDPSPS